MITQKEFLEACNSLSSYHDSGKEILGEKLIIPKVYYRRMREEFNHFSSAVYRMKDVKLPGEITQSKLKEEMKSMMEYFTHLNSIFNKLELYSKSLREDSPDDTEFLKRVNKLGEKYMELLKTLEPILPEIDEEIKLTVPTMNGVMNGEYHE